jgi:hypothetical protein
VCQCTRREARARPGESRGAWVRGDEQGHSVKATTTQGACEPSFHCNYSLRSEHNCLFRRKSATSDGVAVSAMLAPAAAGRAGGTVDLVDVDWSLGVSASSSELQALGSTFVVLRLRTQSADGTSAYVHLGAYCAPAHRGSHGRRALRPHHTRLR